jgi:hypothetical protein
LAPETAEPWEAPVPYHVLFKPVPSASNDPSARLAVFTTAIEALVFADQLPADYALIDIRTVFQRDVAGETAGERLSERVIEAVEV